MVTPIRKAAEVAVRAVGTYIRANPDTMDEILFVLFDKRTKAAYDDALNVWRELLHAAGELLQIPVLKQFS